MVVPVGDQVPVRCMRLYYTYLLKYAWFGLGRDSFRLPLVLWQLVWQHLHGDSTRRQSEYVELPAHLMFHETPSHPTASGLTG